MKATQKSSDDMRWWDLPAALLLIAALITAAIRLSATHWTEHLSLVQNVTFLGAIAGIALGQSRFSPPVVRLFALVYGLFTIPWQLGMTLGEGIVWTERLVSLSNRLLITVDQLLQQKPVTDNMFFLFLMSALFWTLSAYGGYSLTRYANAWKAILPTGIAIIIIHAYDSFFTIRTWFLAGYLFFSLLLIARLYFLVQQNRWKQNGSYLPPYVGLDFIRTALLATAIIVLLAWTAPALASAVRPAEQAWQRITRPWHTVRDRMSNAFSSLQASVGVVTDFYGDTLPLGRGNPLSDAVVMTVEAPPRVAAGVRYYWRDRIYDHYDSSWTSTLSTDRSLSPDTFDLSFPEYEGRTAATFSIQTNQPIQNLHTPSQPVWISRPVEARLALNPDGTADLGTLKSNSILFPGEVYEVEASLTAASITQLREAGTEYPDWIAERYLQLPDNITPRTQELATRIAEGLDNPYDIAQAVTIYLRTNLEYSETVPPQPANQEPVDWILFDLQQAFCNYYATAEIVLLRSLGIPARMAVGYAQGDRLSREPELVPTLGPRGDNVPQDLSTSDLYTVRHRDAHAWPEVYFPNIGWVEFEPTASQLAIFRPEDDQLDPTPSEAEALSQQEEMQRNMQSLREELFQEDGGIFSASQNAGSLTLPPAVLFTLGTLVLAAAAFFARRARRARGSPPIPVSIETSFLRLGLRPPDILRRWVRYATLSPLAKAYMELNRALRRLGAAPKPNDTPAERAAALQQLLPAADDPIQILVSEYQASTYGPLVGDTETAKRAGTIIRNQSFLALLKRLLARLQEPRKVRRASIFES
ncbi:MAG TPA: transglutaminase domain-containing protein [Anaerolineales bacterium]